MSSALRRLAFGLTPAIAWIGIGSMPAQAISPAPNAYLAQNEFATASGANPFDIITGPNGNIWYTAPGIDSVVEADAVTGAAINTYVVTTVDRGACQPLGIAIGPDRNIWAT
jgi:streptogramin lyase